MNLISESYGVASIAATTSKNVAMDKKMLLRLVSNPTDRHPITDGKEVVVFTQQTPEINEYPILDHPLVIQNGMRKVIVADGRPFLRWEAKTQTSFIYNLPGCIFTMVRSILMYDWVNTQDRNDIETKSSWAGSLYANYVADIIIRLTGVNIMYRDTVRIVAADMWFHLHRDEDSRVGIEDEIVALHYMLNLHPEVIGEVLVNLPVPKNLAGLVANIAALGEPRLVGLTIPSVMSALSGGWMGSNGRVILSVALDHPPTWCAVAYMAATEKMFSKSALGTAAKVYKHRSESFISYVTAILKTRTEITQYLK